MLVHGQDPSVRRGGVQRERPRVLVVNAHGPLRVLLLLLVSGVRGGPRDLFCWFTAATSTSTSISTSIATAKNRNGTGVQTRTVSARQQPLVGATLAPLKVGDILFLFIRCCCCGWYCGCCFAPLLEALGQAARKGADNGVCRRR